MVQFDALFAGFRVSQILINRLTDTRCCGAPPRRQRVRSFLPCFRCVLLQISLVFFIAQLPFQCTCLLRRFLTQIGRRNLGLLRKVCSGGTRFGSKRRSKRRGGIPEIAPCVIVVVVVVWIIIGVAKALHFWSGAASIGIGESGRKRGSRRVGHVAVLVRGQQIGRGFARYLARLISDEGYFGDTFSFGFGQEMLSVFVHGGVI
mmetsp:Transcript_68240/g.108322  ORF Transcript_68240/g.108322 Transcript_68240/m.108322 type:complete len:204 (+) Transcript_68240:360-971(+)